MFDPAGTKRIAAAKSRRAARLDATQPVPASYKWVALFVSTLGMLMATIDGSITLICRRFPKLPKGDQRNSPVD